MAAALTIAWSGVWAGAAIGTVGVAEVLYFRSGSILTVSVGPLFVFVALLYYKLQLAGMSSALAFLPCVAVAIAFALTEEWTVLRPLSRASAPLTLIATVGTGIVLAGVASTVLTSASVSAGGIVHGGEFHIGPWTASPGSVLLVTAVVLMTFCCWWVSSRTLTGKAMWGASADADAARIVGIQVGKLRVIGRLLAALLIAVSACLYLPLTVVDFTQGLPLSLYGFLVAAMVGYESIPGALLGGFAFGLAQATGLTFSSVYGDGIAFLIVLAGLFLSSQMRSRPMMHPGA